jgi:ATP-dependent Clp protease ATP-binding subunit ClpA
MARFSIGVELAWQAAAAEALAAGHEFIEPAHLFIGLCSIEKLLSPEVKQELQAPEAVLAELRAEWDVLVTLFAGAGADPARLRRRVRQATGRGDFAEQGRGKISRSGASRGIFAQAVELAQQAGASAVALPHLLAALL